MGDIELTSAELDEVGAIAAHLRGRLALKYIGNCKCGQCQLVPPELIEGAADAIDGLISLARAGLEAGKADSRSTSEAEPVAWIPKIAFDVFQKCGADERLASKAWSYKATPSAIALYAKPLPTPASDDQVEAVTDEMVERAAFALAKRNHVPQWREFIPDARAALLAAMGSTKP